MNLINVTAENLTRVNNDANGNPRYVFHYLNALPQEIASSTFMQWSGMSYEIAQMLSREFLNGRKFHNKQYGGGIVFQSYNVRHCLEAAASHFESSDLKYNAYTGICLWVENTECLYKKAVEIATNIKNGKIEAKLGFFQMKDLAEEAAADMKRVKITIKKNQKVLTLAAAYLMASFEETVTN